MANGTGRRGMVSTAWASWPHSPPLPPPLPEPVGPRVLQRVDSCSLFRLHGLHRCPSWWQGLCSCPAVWCRRYSPSGGADRHCRPGGQLLTGRRGERSTQQPEFYLLIYYIIKNNNATTWWLILKLKLRANLHCTRCFWKPTGIAGYIWPVLPYEYCIVYI